MNGLRLGSSCFPSYKGNFWGMIGNTILRLPAFRNSGSGVTYDTRPQPPSELCKDGNSDAEMIQVPAISHGGITYDVWGCAGSMNGMRADRTNPSSNRGNVWFFIHLVPRGKTYESAYDDGSLRSGFAVISVGNQGSDVDPSPPSNSSINSSLVSAWLITDRRWDRPENVVWDDRNGDRTCCGLNQLAYMERRIPNGDGTYSNRVHVYGIGSQEASTYTWDCPEIGVYIREWVVAQYSRNHFPRAVAVFRSREIFDPILFDEDDYDNHTPLSNGKGGLIPLNGVPGQATVANLHMDVAAGPANVTTGRLSGDVYNAGEFNPISGTGASATSDALEATHTAVTLTFAGQDPNNEDLEAATGFSGAAAQTGIIDFDFWPQVFDFSSPFVLPDFGVVVTVPVWLGAPNAGESERIPHNSNPGLYSWAQGGEKLGVNVHRSINQSDPIRWPYYGTGGNNSLCRAMPQLNAVDAVARNRDDCYIEGVWPLPDNSEGLLDGFRQFSWQGDADQCSMSGGYQDAGTFCPFIQVSTAYSNEDGWAGEDYVGHGIFWCSGYAATGDNSVSNDAVDRWEPGSPFEWQGGNPLETFSPLVVSSGYFFPQFGPISTPRATTPYEVNQDDELVPLRTFPVGWYYDTTKTWRRSHLAIDPFLDAMHHSAPQIYSPGADWSV